MMQQGKHAYKTGSDVATGLETTQISRYCELNKE